MPLIQSSSFEFPHIGDNVIRIGDTIFLNWVNNNITNVNVIFFKGIERIPVTNLTVIDGQNSFNIFIDNSFFTDEFLNCKIRVEMKENPDIFVETLQFKVLRQNDKSA